MPSDWQLRLSIRISDPCAPRNDPCTSLNHMCASRNHIWATLNDPCRPLNDLCASSKQRSNNQKVRWDWPKNFISRVYILTKIVGFWRWRLGVNPLPPQPSQFEPSLTQPNIRQIERGPDSGAFSICRISGCVAPMTFLFINWTVVCHNSCPESNCNSPGFRSALEVSPALPSRIGWALGEPRHKCPTDSALRPRRGCSTWGHRHIRPSSRPASRGSKGSTSRRNNLK